MQPKYTTQKSDQYGEILIINGNESQCPFKPSITLPTQNALGQMQMQVISFPCCTTCPHAWIEQLGVTDAKTFVITCNGNYRDIELNGSDDQLKSIINL